MLALLKTASYIYILGSFICVATMYTCLLLMYQNNGLHVQSESLTLPMKKGPDEWFLVNIMYTSRV